MAKNNPGKALGVQVTYDLDSLVFPEFMLKTPHCLRTERIAQPKVLKPGDMLATGEVVVRPPRRAHRRGIFLSLSRQREWIIVPDIIPIALHQPDDPTMGMNFVMPPNLEVGDRWATGKRILSTPRDGIADLIELHISLGKGGMWVCVPKTIPIAIITKEDSQNGQKWVIVTPNDDES